MTTDRSWLPVFRGPLKVVIPERRRKISMRVHNHQALEQTKREMCQQSSIGRRKQKSGEGNPPSNTLHISNIDYSTTQNELEQQLYM